MIQNRVICDFRAYKNDTFSLISTNGLLEDSPEVLAVNWLGHDLVGTAAPRLLDVIGLDVSGADHDARLLDVAAVGVELAEMARRLVAIHEGHIEVHENETVGAQAVAIGDQLLGFDECLASVVGSVSPLDCEAEAYGAHD